MSLFTRTCLFIACLFTGIASVSATHLVGGHFSYRTLSHNVSTVRVEVTLELIRDNISIAPLDLPTGIAVYRETTSGWELQAEQQNGTPIRQIIQQFNPPFIYTPRSYTFERGIFVYEIDLPVNSGDFLFSYQRCCRVTSPFVNAGAQDTTGMTLTLLITEEALGGGQMNSSPKPAGVITPQLFLPVDSTFTVDFAFTDADQDVMDIRFSHPLSGGTIINPRPYFPLPPPYDSVRYLPGYSAINPFGDSSYTELDTLSGVFSGQLDTTGLYQIAMAASDYRNGVLMSRSQLDYFMVAQRGIPYSSLELVYFFDENQNQVRDGQEFTIEPNLPIGFDQPLLEAFTRGDTSVHYLGDTGTVALFIEGMPQLLVNAPGDSLKVQIDALQENYFAEVPIISSISDPSSATYLTSDLFICNSTVELGVNFFNTSGFPASGQLTLTIDSLTEVTASNANYNTLSDTVLQWSLDTIPPLQSEDFTFWLAMPDEMQVGELLSFTIETQNVTNGDTLIYTEQYEAILFCAVDPNDKQVSPDRTEGLIQQEEPLIYTIRFQNTGNLPAKDVLLTDTIDTHLDLNSLEVLSASHFYRFSRKDRQLIIKFPDINLPDSLSDEKASQGYFTYRITPLADLAPGTKIENTAYIFFDNNAPIITNTVISQIPLETHINTLNLNAGPIIYPNPFQEQLNIQLPSPPAQPLHLEIYDVLGRFIERVTVEKEVFNFSTSQYVKGLYLFRLISVDGELVATGQITHH